VIEREIYRVAVSLRAPDGTDYPPHSYYEVAVGEDGPGQVLLVRSSSGDWALVQSDHHSPGEEDATLGRLLRVLPPRRKG
jgi:hypothetical protein